MKRALVLLSAASLAAALFASPVAAGNRIPSMAVSCGAMTSSVSGVPGAATSLQGAWTVMSGTTASMVPITTSGTSWSQSTPAGAIAALRNPAVNVRHLGFNAAKAFGSQALPAALELAKDANPYVAARAVWLLPHLGEEGVARTRELLKDASAANRRLIKASRKRRIAAGSGTTIQEVNKMLKQFEQSQQMMKMFSGKGMGKLMNMAKGMKGRFPGM